MLQMVALVLVIAVVLALSSLPVMWLWNWLAPDIFGLPTIGYLHAMGLLVLTNMLCGAGIIRPSK